MNIISAKTAAGSLKGSGVKKGPDDILCELKEIYQFEWNKHNFVDIELGPTDIATHHNKIKSHLAQQKEFVLLGGDHSTTFPAFEALMPDTIVVFDAHLDCVNNVIPPSQEDFLRVIWEKYKPKIIHVGARNYTQEEWKVAQNFYQFIPADKIEGVDLNPKGKIYVSIDIDVLDPTFAPGVDWPEPFGLTPKSLLNLLESIPKPIGFDIVEVNPEKDINNITSRTAAYIIHKLANTWYE